MALRFSNYPIIRASEGVKTNPSTNDVIADTSSGTAANTTGPVSAALGAGGEFEVLTVVASSVAGQFYASHQNSAGTAYTPEHSFYVAAGQTVSIPWRFFMRNGDKVQIKVLTGLTGTAVGSIIAQRVG